MAQAKLHPLLELMQGSIGDLVFKRYGDKVIVSRKPVFRNRVFTEAQKRNQERFRQATSYARATMSSPDARSTYEVHAKAAGRTPYILMIADFLRAPTVEEINLSQYRGKAGDRILIVATDDFEVTRVEVAITDATGTTVLEQGVATRTTKDTWTYTATITVQAGTSINIEATAFDRPGHPVNARNTLNI